MDDMKRTQAANEGTGDKDDTPQCCLRQTDIKAALLARRLQRERLDRAIEWLLRQPANEQSIIAPDDDH